MPAASMPSVMSPSRHRLSSRGALLAGASAVVVMLMTHNAALARALNGGNSGIAAPAIASEAAALAAQQATAAVKQSQESLARAARAIQDIQAVQSAARAAAAARETSLTAPIAVPNGLGTGGLSPNMPAGWTGANAPTQSVDGNGQTQVGIRQTTPQAILNWTSFNVGARTTLTFDQQGNGSWVALNRVNNATAPSQILGNIKADGQVYVINQSGIILGGNSQINVGSLIVSAAGIADDQFLTNGIYSAQSGSVYVPSFKAAGGKVVVEAGASIETNASSSVKSGGGYVLMLGSEVSNAGTIATPKGQTILAAGTDFILRAGFGTDANQFSTIRGSEIAPVVGTASGKVTNTGAVWAAQGDITLAGRSLLQDGVLLSSTSVNQRGTIHLLNAASDSAGSVTLTGNSLSYILPELDSKDSALNSQRDALIAASGLNPLAVSQFDNLSKLTDRRDQSRIEIVTGGVANFQNGSLTMAQGGQVSVSAGRRVFAENGAVIDVSGVQSTRLAMAANQIKVNVQGNELRDSPVNRDSGALVNRDVWIDIRDLVYVAPDARVYTGERYYTKGGLLEVGGYLANTSHTVGEWAAVGGTVTLAGPEVIAQQGARINIAGGAVSYDGGWIYSTKLIGSDGRLYSFDSAPADMKFAAAAGGFVRTHNIQGKVSDTLTEVWTSVFDRTTSRRWEDGYTVGRDAGRLNLSSPTPVFEADLITDVIKGERQSSARSANAGDSYKQVQNAAPLEGTLGIGRYDAVLTGDAGFHGSDVRFGDVAAITAGMTTGDALPAARVGTAWFDAGRINAMKLGGLDAGSTETVSIDRAITLADGGRLTLTAPIVDIKADVVARSGVLTVDNYFKGDSAGGRGIERVLLKDGKASITVHDDVMLDLRGLWVNAQDKPSDLTKQAYVNGGAVMLRSTHDVTLAKGSTVDVSSGAAVLPNGKTKGGRGGDVTLIADQSALGTVADGLLTLNGDIRAYGVSGGGTLKLESGTVVAIGGKILATDGVLGAGEKAPADLALLNDYVVKAGEVLPGDYSFQAAIFLPGDRLTWDANFQNITLAADWVMPYSRGLRWYDVTVGPNNTPVRVWAANEGQPPTILPAGTVVSIPRQTLFDQFTGYVLPPDIFPNGVPSNVMLTKTLFAGSVASNDITLSAGTRLTAGFALARGAAVKPFTEIGTALFQSGFADYDVNGHSGVVMPKGARIDAAMPIYRFGDKVFDVASGADPSRALDVWTPPEWMADARNARLTQRGGTSITLRAVGSDASKPMAASGAIVIASGTSIRVDAGQSINLQGTDLTMDGTLTAPGGTIALTQPLNPDDRARGGKVGLFWIGDSAVLDVAARAVTATDSSGRTYGVVRNGGSIQIGGTMDWEASGEAIAPRAFVVVRPGAILDASGTSAMFDMPVGDMQSASAPLAVASNGGSIVIKSAHGLYLDGTLRAVAGGATAAGGTFGVALESLNYATNTVSGDVLRHRELVIADIQGDSAIAGVASMDAAKARLVTGTARLGVDRIKAGGFDSLSLLVDGVMSFDGNVSLNMRQSLGLYAGAIAVTDGGAANARVTLAAPYVRMAGVTRRPEDYYAFPAVRWEAGYGVPTGRASDAIFNVTADLIDIRERVVFGVQQTLNLDTSSYVLDRRGFALVDLVSRGDIRMLGKTQSILRDTALLTPGNIALTAAQVYPVTQARASVIAGYKIANGDESLLPGGVLDIRRYDDAMPDMPYSAFGQLSLLADIVNQGGVVRAPFGSITLGGIRVGRLGDTVNLLPGSITSISGSGLVMPYGGTLDGITYSQNGANVALAGIGRLGIVSVLSSHLDGRAGAVIDISGGGELIGAGFVAGRGGSVNVLTTPLVNANPGYKFSAGGNEVYAIVPGYKSDYAPAVQEAGYGLPQVGRQITIPEGVPGLAAGTYTLMPATYALLPGAYRIEIGGATVPSASRPVTTGSGSYNLGAYLGIANTDIRASLPNQVIVTPGNVVRTHSSYNEMGYNAFVLADAVRIGVPRATMTLDAGLLDIQFGAARAADGRAQLIFNGDLRMGGAPGSDGYSGSVQLHGISEILAVGQAATSGVTAASVHADQINKFDASRLVLNGSLVIDYGKLGNRAIIDSDAGSIVLRSGAHLSAAEIIFAARKDGSPVSGAITIEEGATVSTIGRGKASYDSRDGYIFVGKSALIVSNGVINLLQDEIRVGDGSNIDIKIGNCVTPGCNRITTLVSEGTIAATTTGSFSIASNVSYGTRNLVLAMSAINLGDEAALAAAAAAGRLPTGLALNQTVLAQLLAGNTAIGAPALEALMLNARNGVNVFGDVTFDASKVGRLVLGTPAIYGYGASGDTATIRAGEFIWAGLAAAPGAAMADLLGDGRLNIAANRVVFGYGPNTQPNSQITDNRIALGFTDVNITAGEYVTSNNQSTLGIYHRQRAYVTGSGYQYTGGNLTVTTPLFTGMAGSSNTITAGGDIRMVSTGAAAAAVDQLGATLALKGANVILDSSVVLPSGRLAVTATGDIVLGNGSRIDLAGRAIQMFDITKYSWGGDLVLSSSTGNVRQDAGSLIDLSAQNNRGGTATVTALGGSAGQVALSGTIRGGASGQYDAGGTLVPYDAAEISIQAQTLADFAGLNIRLNAGEVFGARRFQIKQGDLAVGSEVKARNVEIVLDGGSLTVNGTIDASGIQVGSIRLAAMNNLVINGLLDAHGTGMRFDSYGLIIDAPNRATVDLTSRAGTLTLTGNAAVDLRTGTDVATGAGRRQNDGGARGTLALNAPRAGANDIAINVQGAVPIAGARTVAVYGYRTYDDAPSAAVPDVTGARPQEITQAYLNVIHGHSDAFINAALGNNALSTRLSGLGSYHLRPGVDIVARVSTDNPNGDLTIAGDLDLSGYRYGPNANTPQTGYGEPGAINFRATGNLNIRGSINDGFAKPPATAGDNGWFLDQGVVPYGADLTLPTSVTLLADTVFKKGAILNYDLPAQFWKLPAQPDPSFRSTPLPIGTVLPVRATLGGTAASLALAAGTVIEANIYNANGTVAYAAGTVLANNVTLTAGMQLDAGTVLRAEASFNGLVWPKGVPLPVDMFTTASMTLAAGSLIPALTDVKLTGGTRINLRPQTGGRQSDNWAVAPMLGAGATSWNMQLTAGADLDSADTRARNVLGKGDIVLADTHYASRTSGGGLVKNLGDSGADVLTAAYGLPAGIANKRLLIGKSQAEIITLYGKSSWADFTSLPSTFWDPNSGNVGLALTLQGATKVLADLKRLPAGMTSVEQLVGLTRLEVATAYKAATLTWAQLGVKLAADFMNPANGYLGVNLPSTTTYASPSFSVVRTGTGDLSLLAAGNIRMDSLYGVYTAGTSISVDAAYNRARGAVADGSLLGTTMGTDFASATALYQAWYPDQGGNLLIAAGGNLMGDIYGRSARNGPSSVVAGNWLWRQGTGTTAVHTPIPTSWWINFGTYVPSPLSSTIKLPDLAGFTGLGTLGGGNVTIRVGGEAGAITLRGSQGGQRTGDERSQGLVIAVGSTGRVGADGSLAMTGGGDIDMRIAGTLNPHLALTTGQDKQALSGAIIDLRGALRVSAEAVGGITPIYNGAADIYDPRGTDPFTAGNSKARSGITLVPGDATMTVETRGDLVLGGAGDPGRSVSASNQAYSAGGIAYVGGGQSWFSLWTDHTAINLISAGGNLTPSTSVSEPIDGSGFTRTTNNNSDQNRADGAFTYPSILRAAALGGSIYYGQNALPEMRGSAISAYPFVTLAPSPYASLEMLAGQSIYGGQYGFSVSGSGTSLPTPFNAAFAGIDVATGSTIKVTNGSPTGTGLVPLSLFYFGPNSAAIPIARAADAAPSRFHALNGDVTGLYTGETLTDLANVKKWYNAGTPLMVRAGRDIVGAGLAPGANVSSIYPVTQSRGNLILHSDPTDVSVILAGRDIVNANFDIAGPGTLEISAGRNLYQSDKGSITSIGPVASGDNRPGASIAMFAGVGAAGPDYDGLAARYLDPARLAVSGTPLAEQPGKVARTYEKELTAWLKQRYGFTGSNADARTYFDALAPEQRHIFLRNVYFAELTAGGREYNDEKSPRFHSYLRGREAIAALFPNAAAYGGDLTMFGASGVRTVSGGDIQLFTPGGRTVIGVEALVPPATSGLVTQGSGNIQLYAQGSILLGLSRIMTTFGGSVIAWSAEGDINAGRGAKTTTVYTPPKRVYDQYGRVVLSSQVPSSGAGIATLNPIPEVPPGDIDLIAPLGTIDAGEAGIRVSGNVNLAALQILNAANIQVQGTSTGIPTVQAPSISAALSTSNATAATQQTATPTQSANAQPSVIIVEVLGYGGGAGDGEERRKDSNDRPRNQTQRYDPTDSVRVLGNGQFTREQTGDLTEDERAKLRQVTGSSSL